MHYFKHSYLCLTSLLKLQVWGFVCLIFPVHIMGAFFFMKLEFILLNFRNMCGALEGPGVLVTHWSVYGTEIWQMVNAEEIRK